MYSILRFVLPSLFILKVTLSLGAQDYAPKMKSRNLVDIQTLDPSIQVQLKYATTDNFVGENMYGDLKRCYLERGFAERIRRAQQELKRQKPNYSLLIFDGARPQSIQRKMYQKVAGTPLKIYVAPPSRGGRHNYGVAVDLTIIDDKGKELDMGTAFDYFGEEAHVGKEDQFVRSGKFKPIVKSNRLLLQNIMKSVGLRPYDKEWWHYQELIPMSEVRRRYKLLDF